MAFDLSARRDVLERFVEDSRCVFPVRRLASNGHTAWEEVLTRELEGYVGKDPASTYLGGGPTHAWLKSKVRQEGRFLVGGSWSVQKAGVFCLEASMRGDHLRRVEAGRDAFVSGARRHGAKA